MNYKHHKQYRLPFYHYASTGFYFVTICSKDRRYIFGIIKNGKMNLSVIGEIVEQCWKNIPKKSGYAFIDSFVIMPNHVHGIIFINNQDEKKYVDQKIFQLRKNSLSVVVRNFKSAVTTRARERYPDINIWQSRYFDRIVRDEKELHSIRDYIKNNPIQWEVNHKTKLKI